MMRTYYFDRKDGVPVRDNKGIEFSTSFAAVDHCKRLAEEIRMEQPKGRDDLCIVVIDQSGAEIHREKVYP
jgi:hypothetical protein